MKHAQAVRRALKTRTVFNLLGPLVNPARASAQLIGAPSPEAARLMAEAWPSWEPTDPSSFTGTTAWTRSPPRRATDVYEVTAKGVEKHVWKPSDFGVHTASIDSLKGGDSTCNAQMILEILRGSPGPARDIVLVNAAAGLLAAGLAADLRAGMESAARSIDSGAAMAKLELLKKNFPST